MRIKNWKKFQHFKDRTPPWIKLHRCLLDDPDYHALDSYDAKYLTLLWLLASEDESKLGTLPNIAKIAFRLRISTEKAKSLINRLSHWLIQDDITPISERYQLGPPETETETETQGKTEADISSLRSDGWPIDYKERFWARYPRKVGRGAALRKLEAIRKRGEIQFDRLLSAISEIEASDPKFIPYPVKWLNDGRYLDHDGAAVVIDEVEFARLKAKHEEKLARQG